MSKTLVTELEKKPENAGRERLVCFVCTGNTCRSPMAEAVFNDIARVPEICSACDVEKLLGAKYIRAASAGLAAFGEPISENAAEALRLAGIASTPDNDYESHVSVEIDTEMMRTADLVVGISSSHALRLMSAFPGYASKITCMPKDIADPWGGSLEDYKECLAQIIEGVKEIYEKL
jgi:protein-tyrosine phosphatase